MTTWTISHKSGTTETVEADFFTVGPDPSSFSFYQRFAPPTVQKVIRHGFLWLRAQIIDVIETQRYQRDECVAHFTSLGDAIVSIRESPDAAS